MSERNSSRWARRWQCWQCRRDIILTPPEGEERFADHRDLPATCPHCGEDTRARARAVR